MFAIIHASDESLEQRRTHEVRGTIRFMTLVFGVLRALAQHGWGKGGFANASLAGKFPR